jgi:tRNA(fMet)-specific endonuclease VapC
VTDPAFLLDSNICIYLLEGLSEPARARTEACRPGALVTSAIAYAEIMRGLAVDDLRARRIMSRFFSIVPVLPFEAQDAGAYRSVPFKRGRFDRLIAAHALARNLILVTNNEADFADVPGLRVENWAVSP